MIMIVTSIYKEAAIKALSFSEKASAAPFPARLQPEEGQKVDDGEADGLEGTCH